MAFNQSALLSNTPALPFRLHDNSFSSSSTASTHHHLPITALIIASAATALPKSGTVIMKKNGISTLYITHATNIIELHESKRQTRKISRARIETQVMRELDTAVLPLEYKIAFYSAILATDKFDAFWLYQSNRLNLSSSSTARYDPDLSLCDFEVSSDMESDAGSATDDDDLEDEVSPTAAAFARQLGEGIGDADFDVDMEQCGPVIPAVSSFARDSGDDGEYTTHTKKTKKRSPAKPKAPAKNSNAATTTINGGGGRKRKQTAKGKAMANASKKAQ